MGRFTRNTLLFLILFVFLGRYVHVFLPARLFDVSLFSVGIFIFCIMCLFLLNLRQMSVKSAFYFFCIIVFLLIIKTLRSSIYDIQRDPITLSIVSYPVYLLPMFLMLAKKIDEKFISCVNKLLFTILVVQSLLAILFMLNLPTINILGDSLPLNYSRYVGIMGGANVNSNFNVLIAAILILGSLKHSSFSKQFMVILIGVVSVIPSLSRGPIVFLAILFFFILLNKLRGKSLTKMLIPFAILGIVFATISFSDEISTIGTFGRIYDTIREGGDARRAAKYRLGVELLTKDLQSFVFGVSVGSQIIRSVSVSDNSFLQQPLSNGVPLEVFLVILLVQIVRPFKRPSKELIVYCVILFLTAFFNNAALWIPWLFYAAFGYWIIRAKEIPRKSESKTTCFS